MKRALDGGFEPPAPMVPVQVRAPDGIDAATLEGQLDTGADLCAVPERLVAELDLPPIRTVRAAGYAGALQEATVYRMDIDLAGTRLPRIEAVVTRRPYMIVGRNVLRYLILRIDGPGGTLQLSRPRR